MLARAKKGLLSETEIAAVAHELENPASETDPYTLLHILGRAEAKSHTKLVEHFLNQRDDPMVAHLALQILCGFWGYCSRYLSDVSRFIDGVPWDPDEEIRSGAISAAGEYLRATEHPELINKLLAIFENENESQGAREDAYLALARAVGRNWSELPPASRHFDLVSDTDLSVIENVRRRASRRGLTSPQ